MNAHCHLCFNADVRPFADGRYLACNVCDGLFLPPALLPDNDAEFLRYKKHKPTIGDTGYMAFVQPILEYVTEHFNTDAVGLDFGSGQESAISHILKGKGYTIDQYDPFFHPDASVLESTFDFIICCEVIEHFHHPHSTFDILNKCVGKAGQLIGMTHLYSGTEGQFSDWYYRRDITHAFIYRLPTMLWIAAQWNFGEVHIDRRFYAFSR